jgi:hypothetical protein
VEDVVAVEGAEEVEGVEEVGADFKGFYCWTILEYLF